VKRVGRIAVLAILAIVAAAVWMWPEPVSRPGADRDAAVLTTSALADSVTAAQARRDWRSVVRWGTALVEREPRRSDALCDLALAVHNVSVATPRGGDRPPLRNSLERIRYESRAIALMDSSRRCANDLGERIRAERHLGGFDEILGLPLEALARYEGILERAPYDSTALARRYWIGTHLMDPHATDYPVFEAQADPLPHRVRRPRGR
jgi:hypothetical protein